MLVLGLETSCDETAAAVVDETYALRANIISSQHEHAIFGGVVPELASRAHLRTAVPVVRAALAAAGVSLAEIDGIAVTRGPGLVGSLIVGLSLAKALALAAGKPLIGVHHLEGHIFSNLIEHALAPPFLTLLVSGGHTEILRVDELGRYELLGRTRDDAAGEAFDKVAKLLDLLPTTGSVMGGRIVAELAAKGNARAIAFPRALERDDSLDFSFSGLKTAVLNHVRRLVPDQLQRELPDIAASFQEAVVDALVGKTMKAVAQTGIRTVALAGGVAANRRLRTCLEEEVQAQGGQLHYPSPVLCTDNAAMIAAAGLFHLSRGRRSGMDLDAVPRLSLSLPHG
ncbi:MAG: tRNA (adenosine(37)-N6)-threonylcarbamoyltransferase complex transferase subunit TsaD [Candidatus Latescibacteria bacterium]|nr:tRNA (adenosine(37)-N6)-threonylcarbamoyltransferase complex transferase subunit TsaD [Candidatus Latescibacterota bacterium]